MIPGGQRRIAILQGHPDCRTIHFGHALADAYASGALKAGHTIDVIEVAKLDFPLLRSRDDLESDVVPKAIHAAQSIIAGADHLVMIYPIWNGGTPAMLRGFLEQTFRPRFIFPDTRPGESVGFVSALKQRKALTGKSAHIVATMAMPAFVYRWYFHPHPEKNTLRLSGLAPIRETPIGLVEARNGSKREGWLRRLHDFGREGR